MSWRYRKFAICRLTVFHCSGIYRTLRLVVADKLHIGHWGVAITTTKVKADSAASPPA
jgi:hypothetical protein